MLSELGILKYAYEELYTNPKINTVGMFLVELFSDMFYVVGFSIIASVVFTVTTTGDGFQYGTFLLGFVSAIIGKYLKEKGV